MILDQEKTPEAEPRMAPQAGHGRVVSLQICPEHRAPMRPVNPARAIENLGLEGDRHAMPDGKRQVLFMPAEVLDKFALAPGVVKENITTRGIDLMSLKEGTRLHIGDAIFELTKPCTPCSRMDEIRMGLQEELEGQRGVLAHVIHGGEMRIGDEIIVLSQTSSRM